MKEQTGESYQSGKYAKALFVAEAKVGKTAFLVSSALGCLPWQEYGGIVTSPKHLHVITFDEGAASGLKNFLLKTCEAKKEALGFRIYNMQDDLRAVYTREGDYDSTFYTGMMSTLNLIQDRIAKEKGVHVIIPASLTIAAVGIQRGIWGKPNVSVDAKTNASIPKWTGFGQVMKELQSYYQQDAWHMLWEAHLYKDESGMGPNKTSEDTLAIQGKTGQAFPQNCEQVFRIRRSFGLKYEKTKCDKVFLDTRPSLSFCSNGRSFNEALEAQEPDMTYAFSKLGLEVGGWGT